MSYLREYGGANRMDGKNSMLVRGKEQAVSGRGSEVQHTSMDWTFENQ